MTGATRHESPLIRVAIIDGDAARRGRLSAAVGLAGEMRCAGLFATAGEALAALAGNSPDVLIVTELSGIDALRPAYPDAQIVMLAAAEEGAIFDSFARGACGYLLEDTAPGKVVDAVRIAYDGGSPVSPEVSRLMVTMFQRLGPPDRHDL